MANKTIRFFPRALLKVTAYNQGQKRDVQEDGFPCNNNKGEDKRNR